jgi:hypothetical protein
MKFYVRDLNRPLLDFWYQYAQPGRIGLLHLDFLPAKVIGWAERQVTPGHKASLWVHVFLFGTPRHGIPWIFESDRNIPLPGFRPKPNGPQENPIYKWSHPFVDHAIVLDPRFEGDQVTKLLNKAAELVQSRYTYRFSELIDAWVAMERHDLHHRGRWHQNDSMHCGHFIRECLGAVGYDPFGPDILPDNTVPELFFQKIPALAEWIRP